MNPELERNAAGAGIGHRARDRQRGDARILLAIQADVTFFFTELAANAAAGNDRGTIGQVSSEGQAALRYGFARGDCGQLRETFEEDQVLFSEMIERHKSAGLRATAELVGRGPGIGQRQDAANPSSEPFPAFRHVVAERTNQPLAGDCYAIQTAGSSGGAVFSATSFRTPSTVSPMERIVCTPSSGMLMPNSFSRANTMLIPSSESIFNCSNVLSSETDSKGNSLGLGDNLHDPGSQIGGGGLFGHVSNSSYYPVRRPATPPVAPRPGRPPRLCAPARSSRAPRLRQDLSIRRNR